MKAIHPDQVREKTSEIPDFIFDIVNSLILENFKNGKAIVYQDEIVKRIPQPFENSMLYFEKPYQDLGWKVKYVRPNFMEDFIPYFIFRK